MQKDWAAVTRYWLGRFSFTFLAIAMVLAWEGYKRYTADLRNWQTFLYFLAAGMGLMLAFTGLQQRHRPRD